MLYRILNAQGEYVKDYDGPEDQCQLNVPPGGSYYEIDESDLQEDTPNAPTP